MWCGGITSLRSDVTLTCKAPLSNAPPSKTHRIANCRPGSTRVHGYSSLGLAVISTKMYLSVKGCRAQRAVWLCCPNTILPDKITLPSPIDTKWLFCKNTKQVYPIHWCHCGNNIACEMHSRMLLHKACLQPLEFSSIWYRLPQMLLPTGPLSVLQSKIFICLVLRICRCHN